MDRFMEFSPSMSAAGCPMIAALTHRPTRTDEPDAQTQRSLTSFAVRTTQTRVPPTPCDVGFAGQSIWREVDCKSHSGTAIRELASGRPVAISYTVLSKTVDFWPDLSPGKFTVARGIRSRRGGGLIDRRSTRPRGLHSSRSKKTGFQRLGHEEVGVRQRSSIAAASGSLPGDSARPSRGRTSRAHESASRRRAARGSGSRRAHPA